MPWKTIRGRRVLVKPRRKVIVIAPSIGEKISEEISKIENVHQIDIVGKMIEEASNDRRITNAKAQELLSKLNDRARRFGQKEYTLAVGPLGEFSVRKTVK